jgi:hypothetical protein
VRSFETPEPISVDLSIEVGSARIVASERATTTVDVRPADERRRADVEAAEQTQVTFAAGRLVVKAPKQRGLGLFGRPGTIDVVVELPSGSAVRGRCAYGDLDTEGLLGDCFLRTSYGNLRVGDAGAVDLHADAGEISAGRVAGAAEIKSSSGNISVAELGGTATIKTAAGDISIQRAAGSVDARTAYGKVRVAEAAGGSMTLSTSYGDVEVGVRTGTATFLDLNTNYGRVRNELEQSAERPDSEQTLTLRARTSYGAITVRRAQPAQSNPKGG